jgi:ankyrin repeat protein
MSLIKAINSGSRNKVLKVISEARLQGINALHTLTEERNKFGESPLILAIKKKYGNIAKMIIEIDNNIDYTAPKTGDTALMYACKSGQTKIILELIEKGANISIRNLKNKTASDF